MEETPISEAFTQDQWRQFSLFVRSWKKKNFEDQRNRHARIYKQEISDLALLMVVGGQEATDILIKHYPIANDVKCFNSVLLRLEQFFLLKLFKLYQTFKQTLPDLELKDGRKRSEHGGLGDENKSINITTLSDSYSKDESAHLFNNENSLNVVVSDIVGAPTVKTEPQDLNERDTNIEIGNIRDNNESCCNVEFNGTVVSKTSENNNDLRNVEAGIRRSSRQIKVSSKYAESKDKIRSLLKPVSLMQRIFNTEPPCLCSVCKKSFCNSKELISHMKSHKVSAKQKSFPFSCKICGNKTGTFSQLKKHYCQHIKNVRHDVQTTDSPNDSSSVKDDSANTIQQEKGDESDNCPKVVSNVQDTPSDKSQLGKKVESTNSPKDASIITGNDISPDLSQQEKSDDPSSSAKEQIEVDNNEKPKLDDCNETVDKFLQIDIKSENIDDKASNMVIVTGEKVLKNENPDTTIAKKKVSDLFSVQIKNKRSYSKKGEFQCTFCDKSFSYERNLKDHLAIHTGEKSHICEVCNKGFRKRRTLLTHMRHHDEKYVLNCDQCPKTFIDKRALKEHQFLHSSVKPYSCEICGKEFRRVLGLKNHRRLHQTDEAIKCDICDKTFVDKWGMLKHKSIHTGVKPFVCVHCGKTFRLNKGLSDHLKLHDKSLQLKCDLCPRTFVEKRKLDIHLKAHKGEKSYICDKCGKSFMNSMNLKIHNRCHTGEKPYKCGYCDKSFNQQGSLIAHERNHRGERPYVCTICGDGFITKSQLSVHMRKHLNDRPYKCDQCDYATFTGSSLKIHKVKHSDEKPFKCKQCPSAFKRSHHLEVHRKTHINNVNKLLVEEKCIKREIVFNCPYCDQTFHSADSLASHIPTHEILVVTESSADDLFHHRVPEEVAFDIVLI